MKKEHNKFLLKMVFMSPWEDRSEKEDERLKKARNKYDSSASDMLRSDVLADFDCGDILINEVFSLCD
jgi:hypothetical protein